MSLLTSKGAFSGRASTGSQAITGLGFQPKALILWCNGQSAVGFGTNGVIAFGFGVSSSQRGCVGVISMDAVNPTDTSRLYRNDRILSVPGGTGNEQWIADLTSMDSDGFTLSVTAFGLNKHVHYLALGGSDITNAFVGEFTDPTASGNFAVTGVGFQPDFVLITGDNDPSNFAEAGLNFHLSAMASTSQRATTLVRDRDNLIPSQSATYQRSNKAFATVYTNQDNLSIEADFVSFDSDGFTINFSTFAGGDQFPFLALKGGRYFVGVDTQKTTSGTQAKTGVGFTPKGLLFFGNNKVASTSLDLGDAFLSIGATDGTNQGTTWFGALDNVNPSDSNVSGTVSAALRHAATQGSPNNDATISSFDSDGYTLNWGTSNGTAREFIAVAFGDNPTNIDAATVLLKLTPSGTDTQTGVSTDAATVPLKLTPSAAELEAGVDAATALLKLTPSGVDIPTGPTTDAATVLLKLTPSTTLEVPPAPPFQGGGKIVPSAGPPPVEPKVTYWSITHFTHQGMALGDVYPKNLDFAIYLNRVGYCNYDLDVLHPLCTTENLYPYVTDFVLFRGTTPVMGGLHTAVSIDDIEAGLVQVAGLDWGHYLELRQWPFDPDNPLVDLYLQADRDIALVVKDLLTRIQAEANSLVLDLSTIVAIGHLINYKIEANDNEDMHSKIVNLAKQTPGFDFDISWDKKVNIYSPQRGGPSGIVLEQGKNIYKMSYNNRGPTGTHTLGTAQTSSSRAGVIVNSVEAATFRRLDTSVDFAEVTAEADLISQTQSEAARNATPHREITLTVVKDTIDVWTQISLGDTVGVFGDTGYEFIDQDMRVVGIQCTPTDEGDEEWSLTVDDGTLSL